MKRLIVLGSIALILALTVAGAALAQEPTAPPAPEPIERFRGQISVRLKDGRVVPLRVTIRDWIVPNFAAVERFPQEGSMFCQLRAGSMATVINGEKRERAEDEAWWVPAGTTMGVRTERDVATLHTVTVVQDIQIK